MYLKNVNGQIVVDCYTMCVALPFEYTESSYRSTPYYSMLGTKVKFLGVGMMAFFKNEEEVRAIDRATWHPLTIPMLITGEPNLIETKEIAFAPGAKARKCQLLFYNKGDPFMVTDEAIAESDAMMMVLSRLNQGKLDFLMPEVVTELLADAQSLNGVNLRIPSEELETFVGKRYRDPSNPDREYRFHRGKVDPNRMIAYNTRTEMHKGSTYSALFGEDVQQGMLNAIVRNDAGVRDRANLMEKVIRGMDMDDEAQKDFTTRTEQP